MLEINAAKKIILDFMKPVDSETVHVTDALGRVLARDILADADIPVSDNSAMDGFAVIADDVERASPENPVRLKVLETVQAGLLPGRAVTCGRASRIMTGDVIPEGADAVVMVENTRMDGGGFLLSEAGPQGSHIMKSMVRANCMIYIPNFGKKTESGETLEFFFTA